MQYKGTTVPPRTSGGRTHDQRPRPVTARSSHASGQDWDAISEAARNADDDRIVVNMGPQHPSTHGVLRLILEIEARR